MRSVTVTAGAPLFQEGGRSDSVYFVERGEVEIYCERRGKKILLARRSAGEVLGEMGVIRRRPRSATVLALTDLDLVRIEATDFLQTFGGGDTTGLSFLRLARERLALTAAATGAPHSHAPAIRRDIGAMRLFGDSEEMNRWVGAAGAAVAATPFEVGYAPAGGGAHGETGLTLPILGRGSPIEGRHFRIEEDGTGRLQIRDLKTRLGCIVNDRYVSAFGRDDVEPTAPLRPGANTIVAGGIDSDVRFVLLLEMAATVAA